MPNGACVLDFRERNTGGSNSLSEHWKVLFHLRALRIPQKPSSESEAQVAEFNTSEGSGKWGGGMPEDIRYWIRHEVMKDHAVNIAVLGLLCVQAVVWRE